MDQEEKAPGEFPTDTRVVTDTLCLHFTWPIYVATVVLFILVLNLGHAFSFLHPPDQNGFRCGIDNRLINSNFPDHSRRLLLDIGANKSRLCVDRCEGSQIFSYCIPKERRLLQAAPLSVKLTSDAFRYWPFAIGVLVGSLVLGIPFYMFYSAISSIFSYFTTILLIILSLGVTVYSFIYKHYWVASSALTFLVLSVFYLIFKHKKMNMMAPLMKSAFKFMGRTPATWTAPIFILFFCSAAIIFAIVGVLFTLGVGEPIKSGNMLKLQRHHSLNATVVCFPLVGAWVLEFILTWTRSAMSYIITSMFFNKGTPTFVDSLGFMGRFHSGSMFFGSFVVFLFQGISTLFIAIRKMMNQTNNTFVKFIAKCVITVCFCLIQFVGEVNRLSFVFTAMKGVSFWDGCKQAIKALDLENVLTLDLLIHNLFLSARLVLTGIVAIITYFYTSQLQLLVPWIPCAAIPLLVYLALSAIDVTLGASTETILICICEDAKTTGGMYTPKDLQEPFQWLLEKYGKNVLPQV